MSDVEDAHESRVATLVDDLETESDDGSEDSFCIEEVLSCVLDDTPDARLCYLCRTTEDVEEVFDRSDLMDDGPQQKLVLQYERRFPPAWDEVCTFCGGEGCDECVCDTCERPCRHINGINYGCCKHPVI